MDAKAYVELGFAPDVAEKLAGDPALLGRMLAAADKDKAAIQTAMVGKVAFVALASWAGYIVRVESVTDGKATVKVLAGPHSQVGKVHAGVKTANLIPADSRTGGPKATDAYVKLFLDLWGQER